MSARVATAVLFAVVALPAAAQAVKDAPPPAAAQPFEVLEQKAAYAAGYNIGLSMKRQEIAFDPGIILRGIKDGLSGAKPEMSEQEAETVLQQYEQERRARQTVKNKQEGQAFLAENGKKEGVVTLPSGLQYQVLTAGSGRKPAATDTVTTHYRGTLLNGTEFDSSYRRGQPASFGVTGVIKGWTEALQLMEVGAKWKLFVPSGLAYGEAGRPGIPPNATLIFEVELVSIGESPKK